jgi:hypothetical protein
MDERRKFKRIKVSFVVFYKVNYPLTVRMLVGNKEINAVALNLCEDGIAILTNYKIPAFTIVTVKFIIVNDTAVRNEDRFRSMKIEGEVCYNNILTAERDYRLGIHFIDISADERNFIAYFIKISSLGRDIDEEI